jgi:hypothetical protein
MQLMPFQRVIINNLWNSKFPIYIATRGAGKTWLLAVYSVLRSLIIPGTKVVIVGASYRQSKLVFNYIDEIYRTSPILRQAVKERPKYGSDAASFKIGNSSILALPIGNGETIRGIRANVLLVDEISSVPEEIFDIVIAPFTAVHMDPAARAEGAEFIKRITELGASEELIKLINSSQDFGNQIIMSGTPSYKDNHFYRRYQTYRMFIESKGDARIIKEAMEQNMLASTGQTAHMDEDEIQKMADSWKNYSIVQLPYTALPDEFLDADAIRKDKATFPAHRFKMEYCAEFPSDTDGFIKRSWIQRATPQPPDEEPVYPELYGDKRAVYVMGLDPARWNDNFGCVVLKLTSRGRELVYCSAWERTAFGISANKIREICRRFNIEYIAMDKGGGGDSVQEWLCRSQDGVEDYELIWPIPEQIEEKYELAAPGKNILELVNFQGSWLTDSSHGLQAGIERRNLLFPYKGDDFAIQNQYMSHFGLNSIKDDEKEKLQQDLWGVDSWENKNQKPKMGVFQEIQECINETCAIVRMVTPNGTEQFALPKLSEQPEGLDMRRRDRWAALLLANYAARVYMGSGFRANSKIGAQPGLNKVKGLTNQTVRKRGSALWYNPVR